MNGKTGINYAAPGLVKTNEWPKKQMASFPFILIYDFWKEEMNEPKYFTEKKYKLPEL